MKIKKRHLRKAPIIWLEIVMFTLVLATLWLDEFIDIPYRLFNVEPKPYRVVEYMIEAASVSTVGIAVIVITWVLMKRLERAEEFARVCS